MTSLVEEVARALCRRCKGNGEIVTDWDRYLHADSSDEGDEAVAECPDCDGSGEKASPLANPEGGELG